MKKEDESTSVVKKRNLVNFPFYHLNDIILKKFNKAEDKQKSKAIISNIQDLGRIEKLVNDLTDTVSSIEKNM